MCDEVTVTSLLLAFDEFTVIDLQQVYSGRRSNAVHASQALSCSKLPRQQIAERVEGSVQSTAQHSLARHSTTQAIFRLSIEIVKREASLQRR